MPFNFKMLKAGALAVGPNPSVYTVLAPATSAIVSNVRFYNANATTATADVRVRGTGGLVFMVEQVIVPANGQVVTTKELTLGLGEAIDISVANNPVDFLVSGVERV